MTRRTAQEPRHVFVNCPFDEDYRPLLHAITFSVLACGYETRTALDRADSSEVRFERICKMVAECQYALHDISRIQLDPVNGFPRFNMPLELGVFLGAKRFGPVPFREKRCLILDTERYRYQKYCSDIAGQDIKAHGDQPHAAIKAVRDWFSGHAATPLLDARKMCTYYEEFGRDVILSCNARGLDPVELTYSEYRFIARQWLARHPA